MDGRIKKAAHNIKYEYMWTKGIMGTEVVNPYWCTMNTAHIIDDRKKYTKLKFQAFLHFGTVPYDDHIHPYLVTNGEFNRVEEVDLDDLLFYGAKDSFYGGMLLTKQRDKELKQGGNLKAQGKKTLEDAHEFWEECQRSLMEMTEEGVRADYEYYRTQVESLTSDISSYKDSLLQDPEALRFREVMGRDIEIRKDVSDVDIKKLLFDILHLTPIKTTESDQPSIDAEVLEKIGSSFGKKVIKLRKTVKMLSYVEQFLREVSPDGKIHTFFNLNIARSMRGSSTDPNLQNVPTRDEEAKKLTRSGIFPQLGHQFLFGDFKAIEVCGAAIVSQDPNLIYYIKTPGTDMHRDQAEEIWCLPEERVEKKIRFYAKNCFVFPEFYGDYYGNCAKALWENCQLLKTTDGVVLKDHLKSIGVIGALSPFKDFEEHVKQVEVKFWNKFGKLKEWQKQTIAEYKKTQWVRHEFFGFRRGGLISKNQIGNTPIQGLAFHLLMSTINRCKKISKEEGWQSKIVLQIHDEMIVSLHPSEYHHVRKTIADVAQKWLLEQNDWIIVPLTMEFEAAPLDKPWAEKTEIDDLGIVVKKDSKYFGKNIIGNRGE